MNQDKQHLIDQLEAHIAMLKDDNVRLEYVRTSRTGNFMEAHPDLPAKDYVRTGDNFDFDIDVVYLDTLDRTI